MHLRHIIASLALSALVSTGCASPEEAESWAEPIGEVTASLDPNHAEPVVEPPEGPEGPDDGYIIINGGNIGTWCPGCDDGSSTSGSNGGNGGSAGSSTGTNNNGNGSTGNNSGAGTPDPGIVVPSGESTGRPLLSIDEIFGCFDLSEGRNTIDRVTIFIDEPTGGAGGDELGHAWLALEQVDERGNVTRSVFGYYPDAALDTEGLRAARGEIRDDSGRAYDLAATVQLGAGDLEMMHASLQDGSYWWDQYDDQNRPYMTYHVTGHNAVDFVVKVMHQMAPRSGSLGPNFVGHREDEGPFPGCHPSYQADWIQTHLSNSADIVGPGTGPSSTACEVGAREAGGEELLDRD